MSVVPHAFCETIAIEFQAAQLADVQLLFFNTALTYCISLLAMAPLANGKSSAPIFTSTFPTAPIPIAAEDANVGAILEIRWEKVEIALRAKSFFIFSCVFLA